MPRIADILKHVEHHTKGDLELEAALAWQSLDAYLRKWSFEPGDHPVPQGCDGEMR